MDRQATVLTHRDDLGVHSGRPCFYYTVCLIKTCIFFTVLLHVVCYVEMLCVA